MKHPHWDGTATNEIVLESATTEAYRKGPPESVAKNSNRFVQTNSMMYKRQKKKLQRKKKKVNQKMKKKMKKKKRKM